MLPEPHPNSVTQPYWDAAKRGVLQCPKCNACGTRFFTPRFACPTCLSEDWAWEASSGRGTIYSAAAVHKAPFPGVATPYVLAVVTLEEGWNMLTNIVNCSPADARIGARVRVNFGHRIGETVVPVFEVESA